MAAHVGMNWKVRYPTADSQAEFFLMKFAKEVTYDDVISLKADFKKFDARGQGELEEDEAMRLLESRNETKTFTELRQLVNDIDIDKNRKLCFLEYACAYFQKDWVKLHAPSVDPEEIAKAEKIAADATHALEEMRQVAEKAKEEEEQKKLAELRAKGAIEELEAEIKKQDEERKRRHAEYEEARRKRAEQLEAQKKEELARAGVAGKIAKFKYAAEDTKDQTRDNAAVIKADAARRREQKEAEAAAAVAKKKAEEEAAAAATAAEEAARKKAEMDVEAAKAATAAAAAEEARLKALDVSEKERVQREAFEAQKRVAEEELRKKQEAEAKSREESRKRLADKAALWNQNSSAAVINDIKSGVKPKLNETKTSESSSLGQVKVLAGIKKGVELNKVEEKVEAGVSEAVKEQFKEDALAKKNLKDSREGIHARIKSGNLPELHKIDAPSTEPSDAVKAAFEADAQSKAATKSALSSVQSELLSQKPQEE